MARGRILIVDDHHFVRSAVSRYIQSLSEDFLVCGEAENGEAMMAMLRTSIPQIVILDLEMPKMNGFQTLKELKKYNSHIKVIVLSAHYNEFFFKEVVLNGASSYLSKGCSQEDFVMALKEVHEHGYFMPTQTGRDVLMDLIENDEVMYMISEKILTAQEIKILNLLSDGYLYKQIGTHMGISVNTVKYHIKAIYKKTNLKSTAALIKYAIRVGIADVLTPFKTVHTKSFVRNAKN